MFAISKEHNPPHIHAVHGEYNASFRISNGEILYGQFPKQSTKLVKKFIEQYKKELMRMWRDGKIVKLPPIK